MDDSNCLRVYFNGDVRVIEEEILVIDKFEVFYTWYKWWKAHGGMHYYGWGDGEYILEGLKNDPVKVIKLGRMQGWLEE